MSGSDVRFAVSVGPPLTAHPAHSRELCQSNPHAEPQIHNLRLERVSDLGPIVAANQRRSLTMDAPWTVWVSLTTALFSGIAAGGAWFAAVATRDASRAARASAEIDRERREQERGAALSARLTAKYVKTPPEALRGAPPWAALMQSYATLEIFNHGPHTATDVALEWLRQSGDDESSPPLDKDTLPAIIDPGQPVSRPVRLGALWAAQLTWLDGTGTPRSLRIDDHPVPAG